MDWIRTCQECDHKQVAKHPADYKGDVWRDVKCKKCKSEALDYGKWNMPDDEEQE
jgi:hypothetical protein